MKITNKMIYSIYKICKLYFSNLIKLSDSKYLPDQKFLQYRRHQFHLRLSVQVLRQFKKNKALNTLNSMYQLTSHDHKVLQK